MVHYSKLDISGSILIKICICIKNPDLDPDDSKIGQIMAFYTHLLVFYSKLGISRSKSDSGHKSGSGLGLQQNRPNNNILGQIRPNNGTLQYVRYIWAILIKICIWIKNPDLDPDYSKIGQIMAF